MLADEPTGALDSVTGDEIMALIRTLADEGVAVVLVTHEARHAAWADRVIFLRDGRLVDESRSSAILWNYSTTTRNVAGGDVSPDHARDAD